MRVKHVEDMRLVAGCLAVEMHTGDPLFPGDSDVDQLWLILKGMGSLTPSHAHMLSKNSYFTVRAVMHRLLLVHSPCRAAKSDTQTALVAVT